MCDSGRAVECARCRLLSQYKCNVVQRQKKTPKKVKTQIEEQPPLKIHFQEHSTQGQFKPSNKPTDFVKRRRVRLYAEEIRRAETSLSASLSCRSLCRRRARKQLELLLLRSCGDPSSFGVFVRLGFPASLAR